MIIGEKKRSYNFQINLIMVQTCSREWRSKFEYKVYSVFEYFSMIRSWEHYISFFLICILPLNFNGMHQVYLNNLCVRVCELYRETEEGKRSKISVSVEWIFSWRVSTITRNNFWFLSFLGRRNSSSNFSNIEKFIFEQFERF